MIRDDHNVIPISMAVLLHVVLFGSMLVVFDISRTMPITPLAIQATLVTEIPKATPPPKVVVPEPEPEPEPEPVVEEPEPEPDNSEELRRQAEEEKRRLDALVEKERLEKIRQQKEADRKKKEREEAERKKRDEEDKESASVSRLRKSARTTFAVSARRMSGNAGNSKHRLAQTRSRRRRIARPPWMPVRWRCTWSRYGRKSIETGLFRPAPAMTLIVRCACDRCPVET